MLDIPALMAELAGSRPVFHSEADFQMALAWHAKETWKDLAVRLERPVPVAHGRIHADIWVQGNGCQEIIELKYKTAPLSTSVLGEEYMLTGHSAHDQGRYDFCKDIERVEDFVHAGPGRSGWAILLTNDGRYWGPPRALATIDAAFLLHDGCRLQGKLDWSDRAAPGSNKGRECSIHIRGPHEPKWADYGLAISASSGEFKFLAVNVIA